MSSLRERRRKRTAETICRAAIDLAFELGLDNVTTEMIADAAGISPRTFFNYFPYKEAAFVPPPLEFETLHAEAFINSKDPLLDDILAIFQYKINEIDTDREHMLKLHKISLENPKLMTLRMAAFHEYEALFADLLKRRLGCDDDDVRPMQIAAITMATVRVGFEHWVEYGNGTPSSIIPERLDAIATLFDGV